MIKHSSLALLLVGLSILAGCGKPKHHDVPAPPAGRSGSSADPSQLSIDEVFKLYAGADGMTRDQLKQLARSYGGALSPKVLGYLFDPGEDANKKLTLEELKARIPTLAWPLTGGAVRFEDLDARLNESFPGSSELSRAPVAGWIKSMDSRESGGDGNGSLSQKELAAPGIILGVLKRDTYVQGVPSRFGGKGALPRLAKLRLAQQLFGRHPSADPDKLAADDLRLEWAQLLLRKQAIEARLKSTSTPVTDAAALAGLKLPGMAALPDNGLASLAKLYDRKQPMAGDGNGKLGALEALNLGISLDFAQAVLKVGSDGAASLASIYPKTGSALLLGEGANGPGQFWDVLEKGKGKVSDTVLVLDGVLLTEALYQQYDKNDDRKLQKDEATEAAAALGFGQSTVDELFEAGSDIEPATLYPKVCGALAMLLLTS